MWQLLGFYHIPLCLILLTLLWLKTIVVCALTLYSGYLPVGPEFQRLSECRVFSVVWKAINSLNITQSYHKISTAELQTEVEELMHATHPWQPAKFRPPKLPGCFSSCFGYIKKGKQNVLNLQTAIGFRSSQPWVSYGKIIFTWWVTEAKWIYVKHYVRIQTKSYPVLTKNKLRNQPDYKH